MRRILSLCCSLLFCFICFTYGGASRHIPEKKFGQLEEILIETLKKRKQIESAQVSQNFLKKEY